MNEKFFALPEEKRHQIINAAIEVFSKYDYKHASTDPVSYTHLDVYKRQALVLLFLRLDKLRSLGNRSRFFHILLASVRVAI